MKKMLAVLLSLMMLLSLAACQETGRETSGGNQASQSQSRELTASQIESIAANALLEKIKSSKPSDSKVDPSSCRYSINKTEKDVGYTIVYGTVWFNDKYGNATEWNGKYKKGFTVSITYYGAATCTLN